MGEQAPWGRSHGVRCAGPRASETPTPCRGSADRKLPGCAWSLREWLWDRDMNLNHCTPACTGHCGVTGREEVLPPSFFKVKGPVAWHVMLQSPSLKCEDPVYLPLLVLTKVLRLWASLIDSGILPSERQASSLVYRSNSKLIFRIPRGSSRLSGNFSENVSGISKNNGPVQPVNAEPLLGGSRGVLFPFHKAKGPHYPHHFHTHQVSLQPGLLLFLFGPRDPPWGTIRACLFKCTALFLHLPRAVQPCRTPEKALSIFRIYREPLYQQACCTGLISLILTAGCGWWVRIVNFT